MEHVGIEIRSIRPGDGSDRRIDPDLSEQLVVLCDVFEHRTPEEWGKVYDPVGSIRESEADDSVMQHFDVGDVDHKLLLRQRFNSTGRFVIEDTVPTIDELILVELRPFLDQPGCSPGELPV